MGDKTLTIAAAREQNQDAQSEEKKPRRKRVPLGIMKSKLALPERPGFKRRWMNEGGSRLMDAQNAGYDYINEDADGEGTGTRVHRTVDKASGQQGYAMEIPEDLYAEDQRAKQKINDLTDEAIKGGGLEGQPGEDGRYVPKDGIKMDVKVS